MEEVQRLAEANKARTGGSLVAFDESAEGAWPELRDDATDTNWVLFGYAAKTTLNLVGKGSDGLAGLLAMLSPSAVQYGAMRFKDARGGTKFAMFSFVGEEAPPMTRARASQHTSSVKKLLDGCHTDFQWNELPEASEIEAKLGGAVQ